MCAERSKGTDSYMSVVECILRGMNILSVVFLQIENMLSTFFVWMHAKYVKFFPYTQLHILCIVYTDTLFRIRSWRKCQCFVIHNCVNIVSRKDEMRKNFVWIYCILCAFVDTYTLWNNKLIKPLKKNCNAAKLWQPNGTSE